MSVYAYIETRGDLEDDIWLMSDDFRTFDNFYDGMAALWEHAARDLHADWAPERRLVLHNYDTGETKYFKATYIEVFDDQSEIV